MLKRLFLFVALFFLLALQWRHVYDFFFFGFDEWYVFASFAKADGAVEVINSLLQPHHRHFVPVFKLLFFLEYKIFGARSSFPYHTVSIAMFSLSSLLLWKFLLRETGDRFSSFFCAALYAINTAYVTVVGWVFLQQFILSIIFLELALLSASRSIEKKRLPVPAAFYCAMSSLSLAMGASSWLITAVYYVFKTFIAGHENRRISSARAALNLLPLVFSGLLILVAYMAASRYPGADLVGTYVFDPLVVLGGMSALLGNTLLESFGFFYLANLASRQFQIPFAELVPLFKALTHTAFFSFLGLLGLALKKLDRKERPTALAGIMIALMTSALITMAVVGYHDNDIYKITDNSRYKIFPFFGMAVAVSPVLAHAGARSRKMLALLLLLCVPLHMWLVRDTLQANSYRITVMKEMVSTVIKSVRYPIGMYSSGDIFFVGTESKNSRYIDDIRFINGQMEYLELLHIFKLPGELITRSNGRAIYLKNHIKIDPMYIASLGGVKARDGKLIISGTSAISLPIETASTAGRTSYQHLYLKIKSSRPSKGTLHYSTVNGRRVSVEFDIAESVFFRRYLIPCPYGQDISVSLEPGNYKINDIRLYM
jgi:hypothetical protein